MSSFGDLITCPVCFEKYDLKERIPRILPCIHSLCTECVTSLTRRPDYAYGQQGLKCPQCRKIHQVGRQGATAFQENVYIVGFIRSMNENYNECKQHSRDLEFYCSADSCKKPICSKCLLGEHKTHQVVDIEEEQQNRKAILQHAIEYATTLKQNVSKIKTEMETLHEQTLQDIEVIRKRSKDVIDSVLNDFKKECEKRNKESTKHLGFASYQLDEKCSTLTDISSNLGKSGFLPDVEIIQHIHNGIAQLPFINMQLPVVNNDDLSVKVEIIKQLGSEVDRFTWSSQHDILDRFVWSSEHDNLDILKKQVQIAIQSGMGCSKMFTLNTELSDTVGMVKQKIQAQEGIPADQCMLNYGSKIMKDECTLYDYNIHDGSTLFMKLRLRTGSQDSGSPD